MFNLDDEIVFFTNGSNVAKGIITLIGKDTQGNIYYGTQQYPTIPSAHIFGLYSEGVDEIITAAQLTYDRITVELQAAIALEYTTIKAEASLNIAALYE